MYNLYGILILMALIWIEIYLKAYQAPDRRTQQEQINSLLDEIGAEIEVDSHRLDPVKDIENRLAGLKGNTGKNNKGNTGKKQQGKYR